MGVRPMKRGTDAKLKFKQLHLRLNIPAWQAKGLLQSLWDFAMENAPAGDIGRYTDADIALGMGYEGDAAALLTALIDSRWVDRDPEFRLVIHDWEDHAEEYLKKRMQRGGHRFVTSIIRERAADNGRQRQTTADHGPTTADNGSLEGKCGSLPSHANPPPCLSPATPIHHHHHHAEPASAGGAGGGGFDERVKALTQRPEWAPSGAWISEDTARELAALRVDDATIATAFRLAKQKRKNEKNPRGLENPAGYIISELRKAGGAA